MDLDALLTKTADWVCAIGDDGRIVFWNRSAERLLGYAAREVVGKPCCDVFVGRDPAGNRLCYQGCHVRAS
jgi:PAS domain S-box-containing protein